MLDCPGGLDWSYGLDRPNGICYSIGLFHPSFLLRMPTRRHIDTDFTHSVNYRTGKRSRMGLFCLLSGVILLGRIGMKWIGLMGWRPARCIDANVIIEVALS